ncbi:MAG: hypothetical protein ACI9UA_001253 [Pseudoalteromonas tetraodonis]|jgi:hypothetical protein
MDIRNALESEHSKSSTMEIVCHVGKSKRRFNEIVALVTGNEPVIAQRASWVISHCAETTPRVVSAQLPTLIENLHRQETVHDAVRRNTMRAASLLEIPDDIAGLAADLSFEYLSSPTEPVAVKVYAMTILLQLAEREPVLADELRLHLEQPIPGSDKAAFRSRGRHVLAALDRLASR